MGHWRKQEISFFVTSNCNLGCIYCYIPKLGKTIAPEDRVIDLEFAVAGMKDFFSWSKVPRIRYFSAGEATTAFDTMVAIRQEAQKIVGDSLEVELQTNGYFNDEVAGWIEENCDVVWISADGPPEYHDKQRPTLGGKPSSPVIERNIRRFAKHSKMQFGIRITFANENFDKQIEFLEYYRDMGVKYVCGAPEYSSLVNKSVGVPPLVAFSQGFVPAFNAAPKMGMFYQTHLMVNFDEPVTAYCRACTSPPCPQLTSDGYVSVCDWSSFGPRYYPGIMQQCIYGKWDKENKKIDYFPEALQKIETRDVEHLSRNGCGGCSLVKNCAGGCLGKVMSRSGDLHKMDPNWCEAVRYLANHIPRNTGLYPVRHS